MQSTVSVVRQVKDAVCGAVSHWGLPAILALIWMSYSYWHTSAEV